MRSLRGSEGLGVKTNDECLRILAVKVAMFRSILPASTFARLSRYANYLTEVVAQTWRVVLGYARSVFGLGAGWERD